jgi:hypothetical protein
MQAHPIDKREETEQPIPAPQRAYLAPWRAMALGACGVALLCAITPYNDYKLKNTPLYGNHLPIGALFLFALLTLALNPLLRRWLPRMAFRPGELLLVWAMLTTGAGLASSGLWRWIGPMVVAPAYFSGGGGKEWIGLFQGAPDWLLLSHDPKSPLVLWFYEGLPMGRAVPWAAWTKVTVAWGLAFAFVVAFSLGLCALFRKQWVVRERLSFPLVQVPLQIVTDAQRKRSLLQNPVFWAGCLTVIVLHGISTAHYFWPSFPQFPDQTDVRGLMTTPPWNAMALPPLKVFFAIIGATFLLPADVSLSLWFTYIVFRLIRVVRVARGYEPVMIGPMNNHEHAIGTGAFFVLAIWLFWIARPHWREVWRAVRHPRQVDQRDEPLSSRAAVALVLLGVVGLTLWLHAAGAPLLLSFWMTLLFYSLILVLTRFVAESGLLFLDSTYIPTQVLAMFGTHNFTPLSAGVAFENDIVMVHYPTEHVMPATANAYSLLGEARMRPRMFTWGIVLAVVVGYLVSFVSSLWLNYHYGAIRLDDYGARQAPQWSLDRALEFVNTPTNLHPGHLEMVGLGAFLAFVFLQLKARFLWWPFGPIGLAMGSTWAMDHMYFSIFIGWLCREAALRGGGLRWYRGGLPYFLGLLLGEGIFGGCAVLWGMFTGVSTPPFFPTS